MQHSNIKKYRSKLSNNSFNIYRIFLGKNFADIEAHYFNFEQHSTLMAIYCTQISTKGHTYGTKDL